MSKLRVTLDEYLKVRRALGYKLLATGSLLRRFVDFADREGADFITAELALKWAVQPSRAHRRWWAKVVLQTTVHYGLAASHLRHPFWSIRGYRHATHRAVAARPR
jgi:hypothetical protein